MQSIDDLLKSRFSSAIAQAFGFEDVDPLIKTGDPKFADYQANVAMALAKRVGGKPREVAEKIVTNLKIDDICELPTVAGPGFINLRLKKSFLAAALKEAFDLSDRAGVETTAHPQTVLIDYSGPNVAKQMHVGHIRSTILGDTFARIMTFLGHNVVRQNHIGVFGTQYGMLIHHMRTLSIADKPVTITDLDRLYKEATAKFKTDPTFAETARKTVVELQSGGKEAVALWNRMWTATHDDYTGIYKMLDVTLTDAHERGESFYRDRLPKIIDRVKSTFSREPTGERSASAFATDSDGAFVVYLPGYLNKEKQPFPMMLQKSDGGYPYAATDLAALYFRVQEHKETPADQKPLNQDWHADRVIYFIDARQTQHLAMLFDAFRAAGWNKNPHTNTEVQLEHASFGTILGEDGTPFKTRSGDTVKLKDLLEEAIERASKIDAQRGAELTPEKRAIVDHAVGIGAIKYADMRQDRNTDYTFAWDKMLSFQGNTGPYLQMQYTRIRSIYRKGNTTPEAVRDANPPLSLAHEDELTLAKKLLQFGPTVESVARDLKPHYLCNYLYELCETFSRFFTNCPVLKADSEALKLSRLRLCDMVATVLRIGLHDLLGIQVLEEM
ncbi:MAG: arginine--tRNA ligase [Phycisphaerales bacterium]|nr:arginine--tRNA ligase [Phycisphaerales bacterium]